MRDQKHKLTIFFGDVDESLALAAKRFDSSAWLLDYSNYKEFLVTERTRPMVVYTSLGDLPKDLEIVYLILTQTDTIVYYPPSVWSDKKVVDFTNPGESIQGLTEIMLCIVPDSIKIENYFPSQPTAIPLVDSRKCMESQLWSVGCSITHGIGVDFQQRYGQLLSTELGIPCSFLTKPGSAIDWAADQILRSNIKEKDIVIWGLTNPERLTYVHNNQLLIGVTSGTYEYFPEYEKIIDPSNLYTQNTIYKHFYAIQQVINYCKKIGAHLILVGLMLGNHSIQRILKSYENYVSINYRCSFLDSTIQLHFLDLGTDNTHPGPNQHNQYKEIILEKLKQLAIV